MDSGVLKDPEQQENHHTIGKLGRYLADMLNWVNYKGTVKIRRSDGTEGDEPVTGRRSGYWAVHKSTDERDGKWTVSHTKSGMYLSKHSTQKKAKAYVEYLASNVYGFSYFSLERLQENRELLEKVISNYTHPQ